MKTKLFQILSGTLAFFLASVTVVSAQTATTSMTRAQLRAQAVANRTQQSMATMVASADTEITNRINSLQQVLTKIEGMIRVSATIKAQIASSTQAEIESLTSLKVQIDSDTSSTTLKTDFKSITVSYRIYALVEPQAEILAASDRVETIVTTITEIDAKLETLLSSLQNQGANVAPLQSILTDAMAKVANAQTQATAAINRTSVLVPDDGSSTVATSNKDALLQSRDDIQVANEDLITARQDLESVITQERLLRSTVASSTPTTASTTVSQ